MCHRFETLGAWAFLRYPAPMNDDSTTPAPLGWRYAGVRSGIRTAGRDTALLVSDRACTAAARVTTNLAKAPCVYRAKAATPGEGLRAVVVVSGCANALAGPAGKAADDALAASVGASLGVDAASVLTATTGVVGVPLAVSKVQAGLPLAASALTGDPEAAAGAILTTDTRPKSAAATVEVDGVPARLHVMGKGAGMIHPNMATMLAFVTTDLALTPAAADQILGPAVSRSFNRISVDGDTSCNDMVMLLANGASGAPLLDAGDRRLSAVEDALTGLLVDIAKKIAADGEGANHLVAVTVTGAATEAEAHAAARGVARSNLVKAAVFGADPNWGRIAVSAGQYLAELGSDAHPDRWRITICGVPVFAHGAPVPFAAPAVSEALKAPEVAIAIDLGDGDAEATAWGCDLSYDYVRINAEYHT